MRFGVDYYPEQCGRENWEWDAGKMHEMGVEVIWMAEFAWARMEPAQGHYDFAWLDEIICRVAFQRWLQQKYKTVECLNEAWGTVFWSQTYFRFDQIPMPLPTPNSHNPSLLLDWKRFCSDLVVDFQKLQIDILREECPDQPVISRLTGVNGPLTGKIRPLTLKDFSGYSIDV